jgi:glycosyltransferase involved in cell wall biosynthesis
LLSTGAGQRWRGLQKRPGINNVFVYQAVCRMKLYATCVVKNEDDIIAQSLTHATRYCDKIFVLDNCSTDRTWQIVQALAATNQRIVPFGQTSETYSDILRAKAYNAVRGELNERDWWLILDADEFLAEDPKPLLTQATKAGADAINAWQIQFYFTDVDYVAWEKGLDCRDTPIFDRRRYYLINWQERRLFRNYPGVEWGAGGWTPEQLRHVWRRRILNRHYQFRDPIQIEERLRLRLKLKAFRYIRAAGLDEWRTVIRNSRNLTLHRDGEPWRFTLSGMLYYQRRRLSTAARAKYRGVLRRLTLERR